jgi:hypothetical protein
MVEEAIEAFAELTRLRLEVVAVLDGIERQRRTLKALADTKQLIGALDELEHQSTAIRDAFEEVSRQRATLTIIKMRLQNMLTTLPSETPTPVRPPSTDAFKAFEAATSYVQKKDDEKK